MLLWWMYVWWNVWKDTEKFSFLYLILLNSYLLFNKINTNKKQNYVEYRIKIAKLLIKNISLLEYKRKERLSNEDLPEKLHANHFSKQIDPTPSKSKPTRSCKNIAKQKMWECKTCIICTNNLRKIWSKIIKFFYMLSRH